MTLGLLIPAALAALIALVVPLAIHIARKSEQQRVDFAALRWLRHKPRPRSRIRFDERPLLLIRLVLLALVALFLARPFLAGAPDRTPYIGIISGVSLAQAGIVQGNRVHWIAPGFPTVDQPSPSDSLPIASLIRDLDASLPAETPLTIIAPAMIVGADAERMRLSRKITWQVVDSDTAGQLRPAPTASLPVSIRHDAAHRGGLRYVRAAASAWGGTAPDVAPLNAPLPPRQRTLIWLGSGTLPDSLSRWVRSGGTALVANDSLIPLGERRATLWRDASGAPLAEGVALGKGRLVRLTRVLAPANMPELLDGNFPDHLRALLTSPPPPSSRAMAADYAPTIGGRVYPPAPYDLGQWLAILIASLFLAERWLATRRSRSPSP